MEIRLYLAFSCFCFLTYFLSHYLNTLDMKVLKLVSGVGFIILGIFTLHLQYYMPNDVSLTVVTDISEIAQVALMFFYVCVGCFNIYMGVQDILLWGQDREQYAQARRW